YTGLEAKAIAEALSHRIKIASVDDLEITV
ncbi:hypothetical protein Tco_0839363, partial [Tanacetum coccineum]